MSEIEIFEVEHAVGVGGLSGAHLAGVSAVVVFDSNNRIPTKDEGEVLKPETTREEIPRLEVNDSFRVMTFNLRFDYDERDGANRWIFRKHLAPATIRHHGADIIGFQEPLWHQVKDMETSLPDYDWVGVGRNDGKEKGEFCPVFWRKDKFKSVDSGTFWLSETGVVGSKGWGAGCIRIATWVRLVTLQEQEVRELFFLNSHFDHHSEQARQESSRLLTLRIPKLIDESNQRLSSTVIPSVIVVGDFNAEENTKSLHILRGEYNLHPGDSDLAPMVFTDARLKAERKYNESAGTFTNWSPPTLSEEAKQAILIDHILHTGDLEPEQYGIVCELWPPTASKGRRASDHRPVITDYHFTKTTTSR